MVDRRQFLRSAAKTAVSFSLPAGLLRRAFPSGREKLKIGIISDEVNEDFGSALEWIRAQRLEWVELRNLWGTYVTDLTQSDVRRAKEMLDRRRIRVSVIDTPFLKVTLPGTEPVPNEQMTKEFGIYPLAEHDALLERGFEKARLFGTDKVRIFSYWRVPYPGEVFERVKGRLTRAVEMAERAGIRLLLENEHACNVATGAELAQMMRSIPSSNLAGLWDPGNAFAAGEQPYPEGYARLDRTRIHHLHLKDAVRHHAEDEHEWRPIGSGEIDIRGQLSALIRDGYSDVISLETHYVPEGGTPASGSLESVRGLNGILKNL